MQHAQSRILYKSFDRRPPLVHLYDMLREFVEANRFKLMHISNIDMCFDL